MFISVYSPVYSHATWQESGCHAGWSRGKHTDANIFLSFIKKFTQQAGFSRPSLTDNKYTVSIPHASQCHLHDRVFWGDFGATIQQSLTVFTYPELRNDQAHNPRQKRCIAHPSDWKAPLTFAQHFDHMITVCIFCGVAPRSNGGFRFNNQNLGENCLALPYFRITLPQRGGICSLL